ncbi:MAG TPA: hypothetical protein VGX16_07835 [Solirubrobacteraceae bacterium]|jgi:Ca2+:H+ antiporter|nr:hypothetical protein [Solirubrobacteraceae bacterium]
MAGMTRFERSALLAAAVLTALAGVANHGGWAPVPRFAAATGALAGVAWLVSFATEEVGEHLGPGRTGFLQASLANLPELFVVIFALNAGELVVAQTALVGSLLANALLLLGVVIVVGARRAPDGVMRFSRQLPNDVTTLLLIAVFLIVILGLSLSSGDPAGRHAQAISVVGAGCLLVVYAVWLVPQLRSASGGESGPSRIGLGRALVLLVLGGVGAVFVSEWFVNALRPAIDALGVSPAFAGLVIVAIAGNAVEHAASIVLAARGRSDLAISVVKSSVAQIAAFLFPVLVLISLALSTQLTFALAPVYIGALALMTIAVWQVTGDGEASAFEGLALAAIYVILAVVAAYQ